MVKSPGLFYGVVLFLFLDIGSTLIRTVPEKKSLDSSSLVKPYICIQKVYKRERQGYPLNN